MLLGDISYPKYVPLCKEGAKSESVLGLARTGLIFTGLQEGAQPGGGG